MSKREPKKPMLGTPTIQAAALKRKLADIYRNTALDVRDTIKVGRYVIVVFPIEQDGTLGPEPGLHIADAPHNLYPEMVGIFKERMQEILASRRRPEDDGKGPLQILDEVTAEHTPAEKSEDGDSEQPVDPAE